MEDFEPKKLTILRILQVLGEYSDADHKLRQQDIIEKLSSLYGIECERKAVARNIDFLQRAGFDIVADKRGCYLASRRFEHGELRLLTDSLLANRNVCVQYTRDLIKKLVAEGGRYYHNYAEGVVNLDDWRKEDNRDFFFNIEVLGEAIEKKVKVAIVYNRYGTDKRLHPTHSAPDIVNPYALFFKNGHYYVVCNFDRHDNLAFCRIDKITYIRQTQDPVRDVHTVKNCERGINLGKISNTSPYLYVEDPVKVVFRTTPYAPPSMIDFVIDTFGSNVDIWKRDEDTYFSVYASPSAMKIWIMQFGKNVKVLAPTELVSEVKDEVLAVRRLYLSHKPENTDPVYMPPIVDPELDLREPKVRERKMRAPKTSLPEEIVVPEPPRRRKRGSGNRARKPKKV